jgi:hypothetical protein
VVLGETDIIHQIFLLWGMERTCLDILNWSLFWLLANAAPTVMLGITLQKINQPHIQGSPTENVQKCMRSNPSFFLSYSNGRSAARVQPGL